MRYHELGTEARIVFMFIFMLSASYFFLGMSVAIYFSSLKVQGFITVALYLFLVRKSYSLFCKPDALNYWYSLVLLAGFPVSSVITFLQAVQYVSESSVLLVWWPSINGVLMLICMLILLSPKIRLVHTKKSNNTIKDRP